MEMDIVVFTIVLLIDLAENCELIDHTLKLQQEIRIILELY